jgi:centromere protein C
VKFWLGERLEYDTYKPGSRTQVPTILGVRRVPEPVHTSLAQRRRRAQKKGRGRSRKLESEEPQSRQESLIPLETGWDDDTEPMGIVLDYETNEEVEKRTHILFVNTT